MATAASATTAVRTQSHFRLLVLSSFLLLLTSSSSSSSSGSNFIVFVSCSEGDADPHFIKCVLDCETRCPIQPPPPLIDRLTRWDCPQECRYQCMWKNIEYRNKKFSLSSTSASSRSHSGTPSPSPGSPVTVSVTTSSAAPVVKYYGKWPFVRIAGMQELFSTVFSLANAVPHVYFLRMYRQSVPQIYPFRNLWTAYAIVAINTWLWSAVFHARDVLSTERLDYFSASLSITFSLFVSVCRWLHLTSTWKQLAVAIPLFTGLIAHISYLQFVRFDYGWNMQVSVTVGVTYAVLWLVWCARHRDRPYMWRCLLATLLLWVFALFEVFDFPPYVWLMDAHALWHGATPPLAYLFWRFLVDDAHYEMTHSTIKQK